MLALIPARGGSKGLPGKNIRPLDGLPLIAHSIRCALECPLVDRVVVSTDCPEISQVSRSYGAQVPFCRPPELSGDEASSMAVFQHAVQLLECEEFMVLQPTSPLRRVQDLSDAISLFHTTRADSVVSCCLAHPLHWHYHLDLEGRIQPALDHDSPGHQRQQSPPVYLPNGSIYVLKASVLFERATYLTERSYAYLMPRSRSIDIDSLDDFLMAEALMKAKPQWDREREGECKQEGQRRGGLS